MILMLFSPSLRASPGEETAQVHAESFTVSGAPPAIQAATKHLRIQFLCGKYVRL